MAVYNELVYNNIDSLLAGFFPVIRKILAEDHWHELIRQFVADYRSQTPYFMELPREFLVFLEEVRGANPKDPPFLQELAHYEWLELALLISEEEFEGNNGLGAEDMLALVPVLSPLAWLPSYRFPVHRISPEYQPDQAPEIPTALVVYRKANDQVGFLEINPLTHLLLAAVRGSGSASVEEILQQLHQDFLQIDEEVFIRGGLDILIDMQKINVIAFQP